MGRSFRVVTHTMQSSAPPSPVRWLGLAAVLTIIITGTGIGLSGFAINRASQPAAAPPPPLAPTPSPAVVPSPGLGPSPMAPMSPVPPMAPSPAGTCPCDLTPIYNNLTAINETIDGIQTNITVIQGDIVTIQSTVWDVAHGGTNTDVLTGRQSMISNSAGTAIVEAGAQGDGKVLVGSDVGDPAPVLIDFTGGLVSTPGHNSLSVVIAAPLATTFGGTGTDVYVGNQTIVSNAAGTALVEAGVQGNGSVVMGSTTGPPKPGLFTSPDGSILFTFGANAIAMRANVTGGVSSVSSGSATQIVASPTMGDVVLNLPNTVVAPGTLQDSTGLLTSISLGITAVAGGFGPATPLPAVSYAQVTIIPNGGGIKLPPALPGLMVTVINAGGTYALNVYPDVLGGTIDYGLPGNAVQIPPQGAATYRVATALLWTTSDKPVVGSTGITVLQINGQQQVALQTPVVVGDGGTGTDATLVGNQPILSLASPQSMIEAGVMNNGSVLMGCTNGAPAPGLIQGINGVEVLYTCHGVQIGLNATSGAVTSVSGTPGVITTVPASPATGAVTLNLANPLTTPGAVVVTGALTLDSSFTESYETLAAGTFTTSCVVSGGACPTLLATYSVITGIGGCVALPVGAAGLEIRISNQGTGALKVCPASGGTIDNAGTNAFITVNAAASGNGTPWMGQANSTTEWYTMGPQFYTSASVVVTPVAGGYSFATNSSSEVTSVQGTPLQISPTTPQTGIVTLSFPNAVTMPGSLTVTNGLTLDSSFTESYATTAAGLFTTSCVVSGVTCPTLTVTYTVVTGSGGCVALPTGVAGLEMRISNQGSGVLNVCPALGGAIDNAGTNAFVTLSAAVTSNGTPWIVQAKTATQWYTMGPQFYTSPSVVVTPVAGGYSFATNSSSEVTSISGTPYQVNVTPASGNAVASLPDAVVIPGTFSFSYNSGAVVASPVQGGLNLTGLTSWVMDCNPGEGVTLPPISFDTDGMIMIIYNEGEYDCLIWPSFGDNISGLGNNVPAILAAPTSVQNTVVYQGYSIGPYSIWIPILAPPVSGPGLIVTENAAGNYTYSIDPSVVVTAIEGTPSEINVNATEGIVQVSINSTFVFPGTATVTGAFTLDSAFTESSAVLSSTATYTGSACTSSTCTALTTTAAVITTNTQGCVLLPTPTAGGLLITLTNAGTATQYVCPCDSGSAISIDGAAGCTAVTLSPAVSGSGTSASYQSQSATKWRTIGPQIYGSASVTVTPGPGGLTLATSGASTSTNSISGNLLVQTTATALTTTYNVITTCTSTNNAVKLQAAVAGLVVVVSAQGTASYCLVFPASGATIDGNGANNAVTLLAGTAIEFRAITATQWYSTGMGPESVSAAVTAAGTSSLVNAQVLFSSDNVITTCAANAGVSLPPAVPGMIITVTNEGANDCTVYGATSSVALDKASAGVGVLLGVGISQQYEATSTTQWTSAGTGLLASIAPLDGQVMISSTAGPWLPRQITGVAPVVVTNVHNSIQLSAPGTGVAGSVSFTTNTSSPWTVPAGVTMLVITLVGGGGGGGKVGTNGNAGGGGGGAGFTINAYPFPVGASTTVTFDVGLGGTSGLAGELTSVLLNNVGQATVLTAYGGGAGGNVAASSSTQGGGGGSGGTGGVGGNGAPAAVGAAGASSGTDTTTYAVGSLGGVAGSNLANCIALGAASLYGFSGGGGGGGGEGGTTSRNGYTGCGTNGYSGGVGGTAATGGAHNAGGGGGASFFGNGATGGNGGAAGSDACATCYGAGGGGAGAADSGAFAGGAGGVGFIQIAYS